MSILDDLKVAHDRLVSQQSCLVCQWLDEQDPELRSPLIERMEDWVSEGLSREKLLWICQRYGLQVRATTFRKHIRECLLGESPEDLYLEAANVNS